LITPGAAPFTFMTRVVVDQRARSFTGQDKAERESDKLLERLRGKMSEVDP